MSMRKCERCTGNVTPEGMGHQLYCPLRDWSAHSSPRNDSNVFSAPVRENLCKPDSGNAAYLSNPAQYRCEYCKKFWVHSDPVPTCIVLNHDNEWMSICESYQEFLDVCDVIKGDSDHTGTLAMIALQRMKNKIDAFLAKRQ